MDNAQKAIMIGVGLFVAIIIISAVLLITNMGSASINKSTSEIGAISASTQNQIIKNYDGKIISSSETLDLIKKYHAGNEGISVIFTNNTTSAQPWNALADKARLGVKYINYYLNFNKIGTAKSIFFKNESLDYIGHIHKYDTGFVKTPLFAFTDKTNQFYIAPGSKYKTSVLYRDYKCETVLGIAIQKAV